MGEVSGNQRNAKECYVKAITMGNKRKPVVEREGECGRKTKKNEEEDTWIRQVSKKGKEKARKEEEEDVWVLQGSRKRKEKAREKEEEETQIQQGLKKGKEKAQAMEEIIRPHMEPVGEILSIELFPGKDSLPQLGDG